MPVCLVLSFACVAEVPGTPGTPRVVGSGSRAVNLTWTAPNHDGNSPVSLYRILIINSTGVGGGRQVLRCSYLIHVYRINGRQVCVCVCVCVCNSDINY